MGLNEIKPSFDPLEAENETFLRRGRHSPPDGRVRLAHERAAVGTTVQLGSSLSS